MKINLTEKTVSLSWDTDRLFAVTERFSGTCLFTSTYDPLYGKNIVGINPILSFDDIDEFDSFLISARSGNDHPLAIGHIAYDMKDGFEEKSLYSGLRDGSFPPFLFRVYEYYLIAENSDRSKLKLIRLKPDTEYSAVDEKDIFSTMPAALTGGRTEYISSTLSKQQFEDGVRRIKEYILAGDIYQANLTRTVTARTELTPFELAVRLRDSNPIGFGVFSGTGNGHIISTSPERFFRISGNELVSSPVKGTAKRSDDPSRDMANLEELLGSEKERAELAMIVDMIRNDMNRICSDVKVEGFPLLMKLRNVYHLYANVSGRLRTKSFRDIFRALFPGGSISGCPKIRACQIIEELEGRGRGLYTGNFGYVRFNGDMDFNIMIRTILYRNGHISFGTGGGITLLSDPEKEFCETVHKAENIMRTLGMEEKWEER